MTAYKEILKKELQERIAIAEAQKRQVGFPGSASYAAQIVLLEDLISWVEKEFSNSG